MEHKDKVPSGIVRIKNMGQVVIPKDIREKLGLAVGDYLEATIERGRVVFTPKAVMIVDREEVKK